MPSSTSPISFPSHSPLTRNPNSLTRERKWKSEKEEEEEGSGGDRRSRGGKGEGKEKCKEEEGEQKDFFAAFYEKKVIGMRRRERGLGREWVDGMGIGKGKARGMKENRKE
jgi:hypothetical protein